MLLTGDCSNKDGDVTFHLSVSDEYIPAKPPAGWDHKARMNPTTQVSTTLSHWPGNAFRFWLPENVGALWNNWTPHEAHQDFAPTDRGGLLWSFERDGTASIEVEIELQALALSIESRVENRSDGDLSDVTVTVCLELSQARDFACDDFSRIYVRLPSIPVPGSSPHSPRRPMGPRSPPAQRGCGGRSSADGVPVQGRRPGRRHSVRRLPVPVPQPGQREPAVYPQPAAARRRSFGGGDGYFPTEGLLRGWRSGRVRLRVRGRSRLTRTHGR